MEMLDDSYNSHALNSNSRQCRSEFFMQRRSQFWAEDVERVQEGPGRIFDITPF